MDIYLWIFELKKVIYRVNVSIHSIHGALGYYYKNVYLNTYVINVVEFRSDHPVICATFMPLDPFEGRLQFLDQLRHLSASQSASLKLSQFALKHKTLHEDLYSCILEELTSTSLNDRVNIFFFLQILMEQSDRTRFRAYAELIRRDLERIVSAVAPVDGGAVNIAPARKACMLSKILVDGCRL